MNLDDVADSASGSSWAVEERAWKDLVPALPDEVIALIAPSVVVCAAPVAVVDAPAPAPVVLVKAERQRMLTPALPRRLRRRRVRGAR